MGQGFVFQCCDPTYLRKGRWCPRYARLRCQQ